MVMNAIRMRKSVRKYSDKPVDDSVLNTILEAARLAPSWVNVQPWKFIVVKNQETKDLLCEAAGGQAQVKNAQVVICCVADIEAWDKKNFNKVLKQKGLDDSTCEALSTSPLYNPSNLGEYEALLRSVEQITYPVAYMTLAAQELGLGACIVGAFANELTHCQNEIADKVKTKLGLNNKHILLDLITLGYEDNHTTVNKLRKSVEDIIYYEKI